MITTEAARKLAQEAIRKIKEDWAKDVDRQIKGAVDQGQTKNIKVVLEYNKRDNNLLTELCETYIMDGWVFDILSDEESIDSAVKRRVTYSVSC